MTTQSFSPLDDKSASVLLREAHIQRQSQSGGSLDNSQMDEIRAGKLDQSIGFDDAKFALTDPSVWDKAQQSMGQKERVET